MEETTQFIIKQTVTEAINVDKELADDVREFTRECLAEARTMLKFGMATDRTRIISLVLGGAVRSVGRDFQTTENEGRVALDNILASMRIVEPHHAAPTPALAPAVDDSDEGPDN